MITNGSYLAKARFGASTGNGIVITGARGSVVGATALGFGGAGNIVATSITAVSIHACRAAGAIVYKHRHHLQRRQLLTTGYSMTYTVCLIHGGDYGYS